MVIESTFQMSLIFSNLGTILPIKMIRKTPFLLGCLIFCALVASAQKTKYKDLVELLKARQYEMAEPFLKKFLQENTKETTAYLFMGFVYEDKLAKIDLLKETDIYLNAIDSAIINYDIAYPRITEKEIKKNSNYDNYKRRDMRTSEFVVSLSDIHLDIETRTKNLKALREKVKNLALHFAAAQNTYHHAQKSFLVVQEKFDSEKEFYLRSDEALLNELASLSLTYDSCQVSIKNFQAVSQSIGKTGYSHEFVIEKIKDFKKDGLGTVDFLSPKIPLWNYGQWASQSIETIKKEVIPLREQLIAYDIEINKLGAKLRKDSVSVRNELNTLRGKLPAQVLSKLDPKPMPTSLFQMKIAELDYQSELILNKQLRDSASLPVRMKTIQHELKVLGKVDSLSSQFKEMDIEKAAADYQDFVTKSYGTASVLKNLISSTNQFAAREKAAKERVLEEHANALRWLIASPDSIPLFMEENKFGFKPLVIAEESHTVGLQYADSLATGYFFSITPSRVPDLKFTFPVNTTVFKKRNLPLIKALSLANESKTYFAVIYSESKEKDAFPVTVSKISRGTAKVEWTNQYSVDLVPKELLYSATTDELTIKTSSPTGESKLVVIDGKGKRLQ